MPKNEKWLATAQAVTNHFAEILSELSALPVAPRPGGLALVNQRPSLEL